AGPRGYRSCAPGRPSAGLVARPVPRRTYGAGGPGATRFCEALYTLLRRTLPHWSSGALPRERVNWSTPYCGDLTASKDERCHVERGDVDPFPNPEFDLARGVP